ncbi:MAG: response regulator [Salibacteraceae bacterium]|nr:response regulator [Salibacteraceae bacterium]|tara:strand:+ start:2617 stop:3060 length:444 start_codon:yes stop_codon:yes gene_type:complete
MEPENFKDQKVFIVDDNEMTALLYEQFIRNLGFEEVTTFNDGMSCLNALIDEPKIIFLDHEMGTMDGLEILKKIKRFDPDIYVVFVSGQEEIETATKSLKIGAFDYIVKGPDSIQKIETVLIKIRNVQEMLKTRDPGPFRKFLSLIF